jgi:hypothetical protein
MMPPHNTAAPPRISTPESTLIRRALDSIGDLVDAQHSKVGGPAALCCPDGGADAARARP